MVMHRLKEMVYSKELRWLIKCKLAKCGRESRSFRTEYHVESNNSRKEQTKPEVQPEMLQRGQRK